MKLSKITNSLILSIAIVTILIFGKDIILPLAISFLISFVINEFEALLTKIKIGTFSLPKCLVHALAFSLIVFSLFLFGNLLYNNIQNISEVIPVYQANISKLISSLTFLEKFDIKLLSKEWLNAAAITSFVSVILDSLSGILSNSFLILLYLVFIRLESTFFSKKLILISSGEKEYEGVRFIIDNINASMSRYIGLKTITSLSTGFLSFIILTILNVDFAFFWAFLIFVLNYIPTIGSLIATLFPFGIAILQFGSLSVPIIVLVSISSIQFLVGNVIEPKLMGNSLNVSPLVVLISLAFWGSIWGVTGMVLSVPITIMIIIVCSQFESLQWISILLSENGKLLKK
ncbi:MAG: AI-2E family transporter [Chitinophagales bacterium]